MSDNSKQFDTTSAPSTSKRTPTRPLGQFTVPDTESCGSKKPKSATARRIEAERDHPRNLFPTSHKTHAAKFTPGLDDPRDILGRSTEYNTAPSPFTFPVSYTSCCINNTTVGTNGTQTLHIEYKQHRDSKSTLEYQPAPLGDQQDSLEPLTDDATTFLHPPQPQTIVGLSGKSHTETCTAFESLLIATAMARGKWLLLCTGVVSPLLRVQPSQRHRTALRGPKTNGTSSCTIEFWLGVPLAHLR